MSETDGEEQLLDYGPNGTQIRPCTGSGETASDMTTEKMSEAEGISKIPPATARFIMD